MKTLEKIGRFSIAENRGALYLRWWNPHQKKTESERLNAGTLEQARKLASARIRVLVDPSEAIDPGSGSDPTFGEVWLFFEQEKRGRLGEKRFRLLLNRKEKYFKPHLWSVRISRMSSALRSLVKFLENDQGLHGNTISDIVGSAREVCALALAHNATTVPIPIRPTILGVTPPDERTPKGRYISFSEIGSLIDACSRPHVRDLMILTIGTGARVGSIADLRKEHIHFDLGVIDLLGGGVDSNKRKPIVPISGPMRPILERLCEQSQNDHLFDQFGSRNFTQIIQRLVARARIDKEHNLGPRANWYSFRRTFADFLDERASNPAISSVMGHMPISQRDRHRLFDEGSPTTLIYKRRKLSPVFEVGQILEEEWWPAIQPFTMIALSNTDASTKGKDVEALMHTDARNGQLSFKTRRFS